MFFRHKKDPTFKVDKSLLQQAKREQEKRDEEFIKRHGEVGRVLIDSAYSHFTIAAHRADSVQCLLLAQILVELRTLNNKEADYDPLNMTSSVEHHDALDS